MSKFDVLSGGSIEPEKVKKPRAPRSNSKYINYALEFPTSGFSLSGITILDRKIHSKQMIEDDFPSSIVHVSLSRKDGYIALNERIFAKFPSSGYPGRGYTEMFTVHSIDDSGDPIIAHLRKVR